MPRFRDVDMQELRDPTKKNVDLANAGLFDPDMDVIIRELTAHPREVNLDISVNNFHPDAIRKLANSGIEFEFLDLTRADVDRDCLKALISAKNIKRLSIYGGGWNLGDTASLCKYIAEHAEQLEINVEGTLLADKWLPDDCKGIIAVRTKQNREWLLCSQVVENCYPSTVSCLSKMPTEPPIKPHINGIANGSPHPVRSLKS